MKCWIFGHRWATIVIGLIEYWGGWYWRSFHARCDRCGEELNETRFAFSKTAGAMTYFLGKYWK